MQTDEQRAEYLAGLVNERKHYELHGERDKVATVDAEIARVRAESAPPAHRAHTRLMAGQVR